LLTVRHDPGIDLARSSLFKLDRAFFKLDRADLAGIPESTIRSWVREDGASKELKTMSGKAFRVRELLGSDGNNYRVLEASEWLELAIDLARSRLLSVPISCPFIPRKPPTGMGNP